MRLAQVHEDRGTAELEFDIDFIVEWLCGREGGFRFRIAPATLTFHEVFALRVNMDYAGAGMTPFSIEGIRREPIPYLAAVASYRWKLPLNWPHGEITFESPGFTQFLRKAPIEHDGQCLPAKQRTGA